MPTLAELKSKAVELDRRRTEALSSGSNMSAEELEALTAEIRANDRELDAHAALQATHRTAPAVGNLAPSPGNPHVVAEGFESSPTWGFSSFGQFAQLVRAHSGNQRPAQTDPRLVFAGSLAALGPQQDGMFYATSGSHLEAADDGYMLAPEYRRQIWTPTFDSAGLINFLAPQPTSSYAVTFGADEETPWGAAGVKAYWVDEGKPTTKSKLKTNPREAKLYKAGVLALASTELNLDAPLLQSRLFEAAPAALDYLVAGAFMSGNGVAKPIGWGNGAIGGAGVARIEVAKDAGQAAATITSSNIGNMLGSVTNFPGSRYAFISNQKVLGHLVTLKIGDTPVWVNLGTGMRETVPRGALMGIQNIFTPHNAAIGQPGDIQLIDAGGYASYVHSSGTRYDASIHLAFDTDEIAYRWIVRIGGIPILSKPITLPDNTTTSSFVYVAVRA